MAQVEKSSFYGHCHFGTSVGQTGTLESRFVAVVVHVLFRSAPLRAVGCQSLLRDVDFRCNLGSRCGNPVRCRPRCEHPLGRQVCRTKLPPETSLIGTKMHGLKNAKQDLKNDPKRVRRNLSPSQAA